jgi:hypothetical protein
LIWRSAVAVLTNVTVAAVEEFASQDDAAFHAAKVSSAPQYPIVDELPFNILLLEAPADQPDVLSVAPTPFAMA